MSTDGMHTEILRPMGERDAPVETEKAERIEDEAAQSNATAEGMADVGVVDDAVDDVPFIETVETPTDESSVTGMEVPVPRSADWTGREPLLAADAEERFLEHWKEIQIGFVEDPQRSVEDADTLVGEIAAAWQRAVQQRRRDLASDWETGSPDTEELRNALLRYRSFIGVLLPK